jgi:hypothetical protein
MDYKKIYESFILNRMSKTIVGYSEKHHIIPKSLNGTNEKTNIIKLSARDHYFAHCCLARIYGGSMWKALHLMGHTQKNIHGAELFSKGRMLEIARVNASLERSKYMKIAWKNGTVNGRKNYNPVSDETKQKQSKALKGRKISKDSIKKRRDTIKQNAKKIKFINLITNEIFLGSAFEFRIYTEISQSYVSQLTTGKVEVAKNWVIYGNQNKPRGNRDKKIKIFKHKDGNVFIGTFYDFNEKHIKDAGMLSNCINNKNGVKSARGWVYVGEQ